MDSLANANISFNTNNLPSNSHDSAMNLKATSVLGKTDDSVDLKATLASAFQYCASHSLVLPLPQSEGGNEDFARLGSMLNFECIWLGFLEV